MALCPELPGWATTRKVKPIRILLKQETVSGSGISWTICKPAPRSRQITTPAPHHSVFYRPDALPATQPTASKHWRQLEKTQCTKKLSLEQQNAQDHVSSWQMLSTATVPCKPTTTIKLLNVTVQSLVQFLQMTLHHHIHQSMSLNSAALYAIRIRTRPVCQQS